MFERFTEPARQVIVLGQAEARGLRHDWIGTEHLLLGLLGEKAGIAARALQAHDITADRVRAEVVRTIGLGEETSSQIPFTARAKKALERALREALGLGHNYIGSEHILLGLLDDDESVATRILLSLHADSGTIRDAVLGMLSRPGGHQASGGERAQRFEDRSPGSSGEADPRIGGVSDAELDELIDELVNEEDQISRRRQILLDKIEILRAERESRRRQPPAPEQ